MGVGENSVLEGHEFSLPYIVESFRAFSVSEKSVLEGHGFSRAVNSLRASGL
jgi:hypothetical protein